MNIQIRRAKQTDADSLARLCMKVQMLHVEMYPIFFREPAHEELVIFFLERLKDPEFTMFLALDNNRPIGYVMLHVCRRPEYVFVDPMEFVEIDHIQVDEKYQGQGIGKKLAAKALEVARAEGIDQIQLNVWHKNSRATTVFRAMGFEPIRHQMMLTSRGKLENK